MILEYFQMTRGQIVLQRTIRHLVKQLWDLTVLTKVLTRKETYLVNILTRVTTITFGKDR